MLATPFPLTPPDDLALREPVAGLRRTYRPEWDDQATMLLDGRIDVGLVRLPIDEAGLRVTPLYPEPQVAVLPAGHRLARKEQKIEADLADEPLVWMRT